MPSAPQMLRLAAVILTCWSAGCGALFPLQGVKAHKLDESFRLPRRSCQTTVDLSLLRQAPPPEHLVDHRDVLGIYVEGVLGKDADVPPIYAPQTRLSSPAVGYPISVQGDGTISLPLIEPLCVRGMTVRQVEQMIRAAYTQGPRPLLQRGQDRILVSLQQPRTHSILVIRQEGNNPLGNLGASETVNFESDKRGTGRIVLLPAYQNDVLHALAETGGLPGLDAENALYIIRRARPEAVPPAALLPGGNPAPGMAPVYPPADASKSLPLPPPAAIDRVTYRGQSPDEGELLGPGAPVPYPGDHGPYGSYRSAPPPFTPAAPNPARPFAGNGIHHATGRDPMPAELAVWQTSEPLPPPLPLPAPPPESAPAPLPPSAWSGGPRLSAVPTWPAAPPSEQLAPGHTEALPLLPGDAAADVPPPPGAEALPPEVAWISSSIDQPRIIRIPLRGFPGDKIPWTEQDIILEDGDIVFIESRETEFYFTGGLLGGGQYTLPRDYDITVLDAISIAETRGRGDRGNSKAIGGPSALNADVTVGASKVIILRKQPDGHRLPIEVDLHRALRDPRHQILVLPEDRVILRYTAPEAVLAFFERHLLEGFLIGAATRNLYNN